MKRFLSIGRLSILFAGAFAVILAGLFAYQILVRDPGKRCEAAGKWYDYQGGECAQPVAIAEITGRPNGKSRAEASQEKFEELVQIEHRMAAEKAARDLDADRQRAELEKNQGR